MCIRDSHYYYRHNKYLHIHPVKFFLMFPAVQLYASPLLYALGLLQFFQTLSYDYNIPFPELVMIPLFMGILF